MPASNSTLRHTTWFLFGLTLLFVVVWQAPAFYVVEGLANYLPLHMFAETFSIVVSMMVFGVAWNVYSNERPGNIVILACALLAVGLIDFAHMLSFKGMPDFITPSGPEKAINLWLSARLLAALALLTMSLRPWQPLLNPRNRYWMLAGSLAVATGVIWLGLAFPQAWPRTFIAGHGLTPFKIGAEYTIIAIMLVAAVLFYLRARQPQSYDAAGFFTATAITILSELSFTLYSDVADIFNLLGHLYKIVAYIFIYRAVFIVSIREPFQRLDAEFSENRRIAMELRELNNDFVTLLENTGDFIFFKDKDSRIRFCSQTMANITGHRSWRDMIGKHDLEIFPKDMARIYYEEELSIFQEGKPLLNKTAPYYDDQGKTGWVNTNKWPVFGDDNKTVVGIFGISRDNTELKEAEDKVNELNRDLEQRVNERTAQLEDANKELESFSYSVSHDLRTPLRAIDGFSHILLEDYAGKLDDEGKRLLGVLRDNTKRMEQLIDDILKFSRAGRLEINFSEIDMEELAHTVIAELQPAEGRLQLEIEPLPPARGDSAMMHQVFVNLLSNAIKFSRLSDPAKIRVGGSIKGNEAVYYVKDNGAGFDMQYADKLFGVFQRLHGVTEFDGTGIGLAIVKRIITRHGGRVWAEGKVNEGATIYFALPRADRLST